MWEPSTASIAEVGDSGKVQKYLMPEKMIAELRRDRPTVTGVSAG
jgi:hypothetical protein